MMAGLGLLATIPWKVMWLAMVISRLVAPPHIYESARVFKNYPMVVLFPHGPLAHITPWIMNSVC